MGNPKKTPPFAAADAKAAFTKLRTRLEQLDAASVEAVNTGLDAAAITASGVAQI